MRTCGSWARSLTILGAIVIGASAAPHAQSTDVRWLLNRVGERVADYYRRAQNLICTEKVFAQPMDVAFRAEGFGRSLEYELHMEADGLDGDGGVHEAKVARELRRVNGRTPRQSDKDGCFDPETQEPEPLAFLLPEKQHEYIFRSAAFGKGKDRHTLIVEFVHEQHGKPEIKTDPRKAPNCFQISLPVTTKGRIWIDPESFDVLRVEEQLAHRIDVRVAYEQQRKMNLPDYVTIERYETVTKYAVVKFSDPDERLLLPDSIEEVAIVHGAGSHRKHQQYVDYRRFMTAGRVVKE
jgi:hypothetical protein